MRDPGEHPFVSLAIASVLIGILDHSSWFVAYTGMLFGFSTMIGRDWPKTVWLWCLILAAGAPAVNLLAHAVAGYNPMCPWYEDAGARFFAALLAIMPGLGAGVFYRCVVRRLRYSSWVQSSLTA
ncbi:hypothetical protein [uncultured Paludibaculum sp.]|uniref:hypothetical protein n=1 Tax=uncultured Paludibaculum sp. TaxID=1765020 RepID=UPI002AAC06A6|nr:hypothetical protein [uncultured Paludibaculum sp.]